MTRVREPHAGTCRLAEKRALIVRPDTGPTEVGPTPVGGRGSKRWQLSCSRTAAARLGIVRRPMRSFMAALAAILLLAPPAHADTTVNAPLSLFPAAAKHDPWNIDW